MKNLVCYLGVALTVWVPSLAVAQPDGGPVGVLALDNSSGTGAMVEQVSTTLADVGYTVRSSKSLREAMGKFIEPEPDVSVRATFKRYKTQVDSADNTFLYKGSKRGVAALDPLFAQALANLPLLTERTKDAELAFRAGARLIQGFVELKKPARAKDVARKLVRAFPGKMPKSGDFPPQVLALIKAERAVLDKAGAKLSVLMVGNEGGCTSNVNGMAITEKDLVVAADTTYFVRMDCGRQDSTIWRVTLKSGEAKRVPVTDIAPLAFIMPDASFPSRETTEQHLRMIVHWTGVTRLIGVSNHSPTRGKSGVLMVRLENSKAKWSDGEDTEKGVRRVLSQIFPDVPAPPLEDPSAAGGVGGEASSSNPVLGWSLVAGGVVGLGLGATFWVLQMNDAKLYACYDSGFDAASCADEGVSTTDIDDPEEWQSTVDSINLMRGLAIGAGVVGVGLLTWGIIELVGGSSEASTAAQAASGFNVQVGPEGASAQWRMRF